MHHYLQDEELGEARDLKAAEKSSGHFLGLIVMSH
jgi:hypothetical protein